MERGYTLLEMVVVMAILGLSTAVVGPAVVRGLGGAQLRSSAREIGSMCRLARSSAVVTSSVLGIAFDLEQGTYSLQQLRAMDPPPMPRAPREGELPEPELQEPETEEAEGSSTLRERQLPVGVSFARFQRIDDGEFAQGLAQFIFFPNGSSSGGSVELTDERGRIYLVEVDAVTGRVHVGKGRRW